MLHDMDTIHIVPIMVRFPLFIPGSAAFDFVCCLGLGVLVGVLRLLSGKFSCFNF